MTGMRRGDGPTLAERSQRMLHPSAPADAPAPEPDIDPARMRPVGQRHCWVSIPDAPGRRFAGVVISWAPAPGGGWSGRTIYVVDDQHPVVVEAWVPATHLEPA